jgi:hypothetical protein
MLNCFINQGKYMLIAAVFLLLVTIMLGIANLMNLLQEQMRYKTVVILHGLMAITAWLFVCLHMITVGYSTILLVSFVMLSLTVLGGLTLLAFRSKHQRPPMLIVIFHPILAITTLILLTISILP